MISPAPPSASGSAFGFAVTSRRDGLHPLPLVENGDRVTINIMNHRRFIRVWALWAVIYLILAVIGPNGLVPVPTWPMVSQHLLQARAWLGLDITVPGDQGDPERVIEVEPGLDVTPYFRNRVVGDPRENSLISNLAVALKGPEGVLMPAQDVQGADSDPRLVEALLCYVGFPPGPAFLLTPLLAVFRGALATQWLGVLLGGLAVAVIDRLMAAWLSACGLSGVRPSDNALTVLAGAGTLWIWFAPDGGTFLFAQTVGVTFLTLALALAWSGRRWAAGVAFGLALTSRPAMLGALPLLLALHFWYERARPTGLRSSEDRGRFKKAVARLLPMMLPPLALGGTALALNALRFGSLTEFGYRFMLVPPFLRERLLEHGQVSWAYLGRNLHFVGWQWPIAVRDAAGDLVFPILASDPRGMGLIWVTPAFIALLAAWWARGRQEGRLLVAAWVSLVLCCLPGLLYYSTGWVQWGGRFLMDAWPIWLMLAAVGLRRLPPALSMVLIVLSVISNLWAALLVAMRVWPGCCS